MSSSYDPRDSDIDISKLKFIFDVFEYNHSLESYKTRILHTLEHNAYHAYKHEEIKKYMIKNNKKDMTIIMKSTDERKVGKSIYFIYKIFLIDVPRKNDCYDTYKKCRGVCLGSVSQNMKGYNKLIHRIQKMGDIK